LAHESDPQRVRAGWLLAPLGLTLAGHFGPSVVSLGQWAPVRVLPGGWCRWRGPAVPSVALTFDDGPDPGTTPLVLDRLDELGLKATFFCLGSAAAAHPDVVRETLRRGHQIETHGHRHDHHFVHGPGWVGADLDASLLALGGAGAQPRWFRPPYGQATGATLLAARRRRLSVVLWSVWGREWDEPDAAAVARRVGRGLAPGAIVLLHDSDATSPPGSCQRAVDALDTIAGALHDRDLRPVTLDELVRG
jgi:peptidoglycan/xylan/chitin deacetylase (PgdA/CDA1 family)